MPTGRWCEEVFLHARLKRSHQLHGLQRSGVCFWPKREVKEIKVNRHHSSQGFFLYL